MMDWVRQRLRRWRYFLQREELNLKVNKASAAHLQLAIDEHPKLDLSLGEARDLPLWEFLHQDLTFALRILRKSPGFTAAAVLTMALGIGANSAIFSLFDSVLLQSLPVREPARLIFFSDDLSEGTYTGDPPTDRWEAFSTEVSDYLRKQRLPFESLAAVRSGEDVVSVRTANAITGGGPAERARVHLVSGNYFSTMGVDAFEGRTLNPGDEQPSAAPTTVVSYSYWKQRMHSDRAAIGEVIYLNGFAFTIVGVSPPEFFGERIRQSPALWVPLIFQPQIELIPSYLERTDVYWLNLIGRLSPGATRAQAQAATTAALQQFLTNKEGSNLTEPRGDSITRSHVELVEGAGGISWLRAEYSKPLHVLLAVVTMVLLIACANVANLLLSRAATRQTEMSVRLALGGSRFRLIRQLLTESILLASLGAVCGLLLAQWAANVLFVLVAGNSPMKPHLNASILGLTILITLLAGILFGLTPALLAGRTDPVAALKAGARSMTADGKRVSSAHCLAVGQIAISLVLLVGANLLARSLLNLEKRPLGFDQGHVLLVGISPGMANYKPEDVAELYRKLYERLSALPGVREATLASYSPMSGSSRTSNFTIQGRANKPAENMSMENVLIGPSYREAMGIELLQGREIGMKDSVGAPKVALVNEAFVRAYFPGQSPLGHHLDIHRPKNTGEYEIVGVLCDAQFHDVREKVKPMVFPALMQDTTQDALTSGIIIRTASDPASMAASVRQAIADVDPNLPVAGTRTLNNQITSTFRTERVAAELVGFFGALALLLACVGLYGVVAQSVSRRTNEFGVRIALGARPADILWMVLRNTATLLSTGVAIGLPAALSTTRLLGSQLYGIAPADPVSLAIAILVLAGVAICAGVLPARRAAAVEPTVALRYE